MQGDDLAAAAHGLHTGHVRPKPSASPRSPLDGPAPFSRGSSSDGSSGSPGHPDGASPGCEGASGLLWGDVDGVEAHMLSLLQMPADAATLDGAKDVQRQLRSTSLQVSPEGSHSCSCCSMHAVSALVRTSTRSSAGQAVISRLLSITYIGVKNMDVWVLRPMTKLHGCSFLLILMHRRIVMVWRPQLWSATSCCRHLARCCRRDQPRRMHRAS